MSGEAGKAPDPIEIVEFISEMPASAVLVAVMLGIALGALGVWVLTHVTVEDERHA